MVTMRKGVILMPSIVPIRKHRLVLITLLLGSSISLIGCSSLTTSLTKQSTPTSTASTTLDTNSSTGNNGSLSPENTLPQTQAQAQAQTSTLKSNQNMSEADQTTTSKTTQKAKTLSISKAKYNELKYGETYEKIVGLLGETGDIVTESGTKGHKGYTVTYLYHVKSSSGGEVFLAFKDNKLVNKMEVNLQ
jgi:hypothetical protein